MVRRPESTVGALPSEVLFVEDASWPTSNRQALIIVLDVLLMFKKKKKKNYLIDVLIYLCDAGNLAVR